MTDKNQAKTAADRHADPALQAELVELQEYLQAGPPAQPGEALDLAVLRQARSALTATGGHPPRPWPWTRKWTHNLATAAVAVVAVTLLLQLREETPMPLQEERPATAPASQKAVEQVDTQGSGQATRPALRMMAPPVSARSMQSNEAEADSAVSNDEYEQSLPAGEWLAQIEALYASGERAAARQELVAFRARYPDFDIPDYLTEP